MNHPSLLALLLGSAVIPGLPVASAAAEPLPAPAIFEIEGDWTLRVSLPEAPGQPALSEVVEVPRPEKVHVAEENHARLPLFDPKAAGWRKGAPLLALRAQETTTPDILHAGSVTVAKAEQTHARSYERGKDYELDERWGTVGRLAEGAIGEGQAVSIRYDYTPLRLDDVVLDASGNVLLVPGQPKAAAPLPGVLTEGHRLLGRLWLPGPLERLDESHLFPLLETAYPEPAKPSPTPAEKFAPRTLAKLRAGEPLRILAWGDSVTASTWLPDRERAAWQEQFVSRLKERFPAADIELVTEAWGGRNTASYLAEPPGSEHNYEEKVLGAKPDLIVSEFVNDAGLKPEQVEERYGKLLRDFQAIGAEWIILTPHYTRPDWMGLDGERDIDDDPRPYVLGLREFAKDHPVALAEGSLRFGRLWRQAIPYSSLMLNSINHPDERGMSLFADALMELFPDTAKEAGGL